MTSSLWYRRIFTAAGGFLLLFGLLPFQWNIGVLLMCLSGVVLLLYPRWSKQIGRWRRPVELFLILCVIFMVVYTAIWGYFAYFRQPPRETPEGSTVIVLGCKVNGDEPSLMLRRRLDTCCEYLSRHPESVCIVSGGQGDNEDFSEAFVMKQYLMRRGIDPKRIYEEGRSRNTRENLRFSLAIQREEQLPQTVVLCSDGFHQLRAWVYAQKNGTDSRAISSRTPFWLIPYYSIRELFALVPAFLSV